MNQKIKLPPLRELIIYMLLIFTGILLLMAIARHLSRKINN